MSVLMLGFPGVGNELTMTNLGERKNQVRLVEDTENFLEEVKAYLNEKEVTVVLATANVKNFEILDEARLPYTVVVPLPNLKEACIDRLNKSGYRREFTEVYSMNFNKDLTEVTDYIKRRKQVTIELELESEYMLDVLEDLLLIK